MTTLLLAIITKWNILALHYVKSVRIQGYSGPHFPAFGLNNSEYEHFLRSANVWVTDYIG